MSQRFNRVLFYAVLISLSAHVGLFAFLLLSPADTVFISSSNEGARGLEGVIEMSLMNPASVEKAAGKTLSTQTRQTKKRSKSQKISKPHYGQGLKGAGSDAAGFSQNAYAALRQKIYRNRFYPTKAKQNGYEGSVKVYFQTLKDGSLKDLKILKSSGFSILDEAALTAVKRSAPLNVTGQKLALVIEYGL